MSIRLHLFSTPALKEDDAHGKRSQFDTEKEALDYIYKFFGVTSSQESV